MALTAASSVDANARAQNDGESGAGKRGTRRGTGKGGREEEGGEGGGLPNRMTPVYGHNRHDALLRLGPK